MGGGGGNYSCNIFIIFVYLRYFSSSFFISQWPLENQLP